jgi:archaellum component FlaC
MLGFGHDGRSEQRQMATIEERVTDLEARMTPDIRAEMRLGFEEMREGFEEVRKQFGQVDRRFEQIDKRFEHLEYRLERLEGRVERLDDKVDRHFMWVVGIQFTTMIIFIGALAAAVLRGV